jgi:NitT/TauT family transport system permease protein
MIGRWWKRRHHSKSASARIVSEVASWEQVHLQAAGLGAYIAQETERGDFPRIVLGIIVMSLYVVIINRGF